MTMHRSTCSDVKAGVTTGCWPMPRAADPGSLSSSNSAGPCPLPPILDPLSSSRNAGGWSGGEYPHAPLPPALHNLVLVTPRGRRDVKSSSRNAWGTMQISSLERRGAPPCPAHLLSQGVGRDAGGYFSATFLILSSRTAPLRYVE